jgi:hypothetical protein
MPRHTTTAGRRLPVLDPDRLAEVFKVLQREHGTQRAAAGRLGLTPIQFWQRVHRRGGAQITTRVFRALKRELVTRLKRARREGRRRDVRRLESTHRTLVEAVASPDGLRTVDAVWRPWLHKAWKPWATRSTRRSLVFSTDGSDRERYKCVDLLQRLKARPALRGHLAAFDALIRQRAAFGVNEKLRAYLALYQALDPLLNGERTGGIERGWEDMTDQELARYLKAAHTCAAILLNREGVLSRAAKARPPS